MANSHTPRGHEEVVSAPPVFFSNYDAPEQISHEEICEAAEELVGIGHISGAQRLGATWRLYPVSLEVRARLVGKQLRLRHKSITLYSQDPNTLRDSEGNVIPRTRLTIDGLPVSVASIDVEGCLRKAGAGLRSRTLWEKVRRQNGNLCPRWITGRRFIWIDLPKVPLPHKLKIGNFVASLFYREQPKPAVTCHECGSKGHKKGDPACLSLQPENKGMSLSSTPKENVGRVSNSAQGIQNDTIIDETFNVSNITREVLGEAPGPVPSLVDPPNSARVSDQITPAAIPMPINPVLAPPTHAPEGAVNNDPTNGENDDNWSDFSEASYENMEGDSSGSFSGDEESAKHRENPRSKEMSASKHRTKKGKRKCKSKVKKTNKGKKAEKAPVQATLTEFLFPDSVRPSLKRQEPAEPTSPDGEVQPQQRPRTDSI